MQIILGFFVHSFLLKSEGKDFYIEIHSSHEKSKVFFVESVDVGFYGIFVV